MRRVCVFRPFVMALLVAVAMAPFLTTAQVAGKPAPRTNAFNDPFVQVTSAIPLCPVPEGPLYTEAEVRELAHVRSQHGGSCHRVGRCRLPNSYLYDAEIIPRVQKAITYDGRYENTSIWLLGQRRHVWLKGCVHSAALIDQPSRRRVTCRSGAASSCPTA